MSIKETVNETKDELDAMLQAMCHIRGICEKALDEHNGTLLAYIDDLERAEKAIAQIADELHAVMRKKSPSAILAERHGLDLKRFVSQGRVKFVGVRKTGQGAQLWEIDVMRAEGPRANTCEITADGRIVMAFTSFNFGLLEKCAVRALLNILAERVRIHKMHKGVQEDGARAATHTEDK